MRSVGLVAATGTAPLRSTRPDRIGPARSPAAAAGRRRAQWADIATLDRYHPEPARVRADLRQQRLLPWWSYRNNLQQWADPDSVPKARRLDYLWRHTDRWGWEFLPEMIAFHGLYYL